MKHVHQTIPWLLIASLLFLHCERIKSPFELPFETEFDSNHLLTDEELLTEEDPDAPAERAEWVEWISKNNIPIRSLDAEVFTDLQFLKPLLENRRIVQLGESGHGVAQFSQAKVRLIKFLHQECGFDVIAFESSIFECFYTNENVASMTPIEMMRHSIFGVWHTREVEPLFDYIKNNHNTNSPLTLAGFDVQISSCLGVNNRPQFFKDVISKIDFDFADDVYQLDSTFTVKTTHYSTYPNYLTNNQDTLIAQYENIVTFMDQHRDEYAQIFSDNPGVPLIVRQTAWSMIRYINELVEYDEENYQSSTRWRDEGMADNLDFLLEELYPNSKIIVWAHNFHIRHWNLQVSGTIEVETMGTWVALRHRPELYTIGLYMYRGQAAWNNREIYDITRATSGSLESILYRTRRKFCFVDLFNQTRGSGNSWMFEPIAAKTWGFSNITMVLKNQYDGILFIDTVNPPDYIPWNVYEKALRKELLLYLN